MTCFAVPAAPGLPTTSDAKPEQITVSWIKPLKDGGSSITGYTVEYRAEGGNWKAANDGVSVTTLSMTVRGLQPNTAYQFRVYAHNKVCLRALFMRNSARKGAKIAITRKRLAFTFVLFPGRQVRTFTRLNKRPHDCKRHRADVRWQASRSRRARGRRRQAQSTTQSRAKAHDHVA